MRSQVGIVGAGQLARMLQEAATPRDIGGTVLANNAEESAAKITPQREIGSPNSLEALRKLAESCDVLTFDHELVDSDNLAQLENEGASLHPSAAVIATAQNKLRQRRLFSEFGLPVPEFIEAPDLATIERFAADHGWPVALKAIRGGYDGRGVWIVDSSAEAQTVLSETTSAGLALIVERAVAISQELSIQVARRPGGEMVAYPVVETVQSDGICTEIIAPAQIDAELAQQAKLIGLTVAERLEVVGMLAVELFVEEGQLLINEIATRPHNSGHYSIEGSLTSQFENHLRAVLDLPLGSTALLAPAVVTVNILGADSPPAPEALQEALKVDGLHIHLYGKDFRPGRKLGHVTVLGGDSDSALTSARLGGALLSGERVLSK